MSKSHRLFIQIADKLEGWSFFHMVSGDTTLKHLLHDVETYYYSTCKEQISLRFVYQTNLKVIYPNHNLTVKEVFPQEAHITLSTHLPTQFPQVPSPPSTSKMDPPITPAPTEPSLNLSKTTQEAPPASSDIDTRPTPLSQPLSQPQSVTHSKTIRQDDSKVPDVKTPDSKKSVEGTRENKLVESDTDNELDMLELPNKEVAKINQNKQQQQPTKSGKSVPKSRKKSLVSTQKKSNLVSSSKITPSKFEENSQKEENPSVKRKRDSLATSSELPPKRQKKASKKPPQIKSTATVSKTAPKPPAGKNTKGNGSTFVEPEKQNVETKSGKSEKVTKSGEKSGKTENLTKSGKSNGQGNKREEVEKLKENDESDYFLSSSEDLGEDISPQKPKKTSVPLSNQAQNAKFFARHGASLEATLTTTDWSPEPSSEDEEEERLKIESGLGDISQPSVNNC